MFSPDWILATATGVLLALSFPKFGHPACAWVALAPLLLALRGGGTLGQPQATDVRRATLLGWWSGLLYFAGTTYWTSGVLAQFGGMPAPLAWFAMLLLAGYLALYPALAAGATAVCVRAIGDRGLLLMAPAWVATEFLRGQMFGGFPWVPLGNSQVEVLPVAQLASLVGVYGLSGFVALVSILITAVMLSSGRLRVASVLATVLAVGGVGAWGGQRIARAALGAPLDTLRVGLVQGNIAQADKWDPRQARTILSTYVAMSRDVVRRGAQYVIWPESSTPAMFEEDVTVATTVKELARELKVPILFGSDQFERGSNPRFYNAAFLLGEDGATRAVYRKMQLVSFGEFFPLQHWISFVAPLVERSAPFAAGESVVLLPVAGRPTSTAICYEVVFPELAREAVSKGSELLTTVTNDGWYGQTSAPYQHFAMASMRAIEQGRFLARSANTGISGIVDPYGRVVARTAIFEQAGLVGTVGFHRVRTVYGVTGDVAAWGAVVLTVLALAGAWRAGRRAGHTGDRRRVEWQQSDSKS